MTDHDDKAREHREENAKPNTLTLQDLLGDRYELAKEALDQVDALQQKHIRLCAVAEASERLVASLPKCDDCSRPATRAFRRGEARYCDEHGANILGHEAPEYPRAQPLRDMIAALDALRKAPTPYVLPEPGTP